MQLPSRHGISRAKLFLDLADDCRASERDHHEAYLEAAIVFCRTAILRLIPRYKKSARWKAWFDLLLMNASIEFIRSERNFILKEAPPKVGQITYGGGLEVDRAKYLYYYENPNVPAVDTVRRHVAEVERVILEGEKLFGGGAKVKA